MLSQDFLQKSLRIFSCSPKNLAHATVPDLQSAYLVSLLIDKIGMSFGNIALETVYLTSSYQQFLAQNMAAMKEDYFLFFLENTSQDSYALGFVEKALEEMKNTNQMTQVLIHSLICDEASAKKCMEKYPNIVGFIRTDVEYFFQELLGKKTPIDDIANVLFRDEQTGQIIATRTEAIDYDTEKYTIGAYRKGYIFRQMKHTNYLIQMLDKDGPNTDNRFYSRITKTKAIATIKASRDNPQLPLETARGSVGKCLYNDCGDMLSPIRQIPLSVIKWDVERFLDTNITQIMIQDECFLTMNESRMEDLIELFAQFPSISLNIRVNHERCTPKMLKLLERLPINSVEMYMPSASPTTNALMKEGSNKEALPQAIDAFKKQGAQVTLRLFLGLVGDTLADFKETVKQATSLEPNTIAVDILALDPRTELARRAPNYGIMTKTSLFDLPQVTQTNTLSAEDMAKAQQFLLDMMRNQNTVSLILK